MFFQKRAGIFRYLLLFIFSLFLLLGSNKNVSAIYISQNFTLSFGFFAGDESAFSRYENRPYPSLMPFIDLKTNLDLNLTFPDDISLKLQGQSNDDLSALLGLQYQNWNLNLGSQILRINTPLLALNKDISGLLIGYQGQKRGFEAFLSQKQSVYNETTIKGDDTAGPFFLGHLNIIFDSETVYINGEKQERGSGPFDRDYYLDYAHGFIYFNKIILSHQTIKVEYEYSLSKQDFASTFGGATVFNQGAKGGVEAFLLIDSLPLDQESFFSNQGFFNIFLGAKANLPTSLNSDLQSIVKGNILQQFQTPSLFSTEEFLMQSEQKIYHLSNKPVIYEREKVFIDDEQLTRYLDYLIDYENAKLEILTAFAEHSVLKVEYNYLVVDQIFAEKSQGIYWENRFSLRLDNFRNHSSLTLISKDYQPFSGGQSPLKGLYLTSENQWIISPQWMILTSFTLFNDYKDYTFKPSFAFVYDRGLLKQTYTLEGFFSRDQSHKDRDPVLKGEILYSDDFDLSITFEKPLGSEVDKLVEECQLKLSGRFNNTLYLISYHHGGKDFQEAFEGTLSLPFTVDKGRGLLRLQSHLFFRDSFQSQPRLVLSSLGQWNYFDATFFYLQSRLQGSLIKEGDFSSFSYNINNELGRDFANGSLINYQLRLKGKKSFQKKIAGDFNKTTDHLLTFFTPLGQKMTFTQVFAYQKSDAQRRGQEVISRNFTLNSTWGYQWQALSLNLSYQFLRSQSSFDDVVSEKSTHQGSLKVGYQWSDDLRVTALVNYAIYDWERSRFNFQLKPTQKLSANLNLVAKYDLIRMNDLNKGTHLFDAHTFEMGFQYLF